MPQTFFTADTHLGHANIIHHCQRPFANVDEMNATIIANWNSCVGPRDTVWHLGDFSLEGPDAVNQYLAKLNGKINLIVGNHDRNSAVRFGRFHSTQYYKEISVDGRKLILYHYGMRVWNNSRRGSIQLYGHSHGRLPGNNQSLDVGVDCWQFRPILLETILLRLATLPPYYNEEKLDGRHCEL